MGPPRNLHGVDHERCDACDFDGARYDDLELPEAIRSLGPRWTGLLAAAGPELRTRPEPEVWSAIEYAAHCRDITALHVFGVGQALELDEPTFPEIEDDLIDAAAADYAAADARDVLVELDDQARQLAGLAEDAGPASWGRGLTIGEHRTDVRRLLEHALHDAQHHLVDVERGLAVLRS